MSENPFDKEGFPPPSENAIKALQELTIFIHQMADDFLLSEEESREAKLIDYFAVASCTFTNCMSLYRRAGVRWDYLDKIVMDLMSDYRKLEEMSDRGDL